MTQSSTPQRHVKKPEAQPEIDMASLKAEAKALGINSFGLSKSALVASIAAVKGALAKPEISDDPEELPPGAPEPSDEPEQEPDEQPNSDENGEPLGPKALKRVPLGVHRQRLGGDPRKGFYRRWINDVYGRIERAKRAGYVNVKDAQGQPISAPAGTQEEGGGLRAYLMELPQALRTQDEEAKRATNLELDDAINRGAIDHQKEDRRYVPKAGISIRQGR